ncbi:protein BIG GRAIN 1-like B [Salvia miltiorrhiza]|uniref:protein BIG GRAIN 1-like B n=1 Tax=Salvia miltiorrhiza TaxID=226208 RepID=UPI0025ABDFF0|nr:protein BIG GRAIN 1-like B [Salvia miltiorrhiza]
MSSSREKQWRQENPKPKKSHRNTPSFSSSLLDEICRSIDEKPEPQTAPFSRVEKWMESDKTVSRRRPRFDNAVFPDNDPPFLSTSASSANRPKPVRTARDKDCYLFDEYEEHERKIAAAAAAAGGRDDLIKSKSRAMRIYANLKKMKQPVSPGARLTTFFSSIFAGLNRKKSNRNNAAAESPAKMLARCSTKSSDNTRRDGIEIRNARSDLARAVADRGTMPRGQESLGGDGRPPLPPNVFRNFKKCDSNKLRCYESDEDDERLPLPPNVFRNFKKCDLNKLRCCYESDGEEGDAISESSSDLFELDFGIKDRFCEELPVYETTYFDKNRRLFR